MTMLLDGRLRDLATQTHLLETKVSSLGWMAGAGAQTLKSMTRAQAHLMLAECDLLDAIDHEREEGTARWTMSTLDILGNTSEQADSIRLMLKVRGMKDGRFIDADPLIILKADNHQGSDRWDVYVSKTVYPTAESCGTLAGVPRMLADDVEVEIMAREKEMGGGQ